MRKGIAPMLRIGAAADGVSSGRGGSFADQFGQAADVRSAGLHSPGEHPAQFFELVR